MTGQQKPKTTAQPISASEKLAIQCHWAAKTGHTGHKEIDPLFYRGFFHESAVPCSPANRWTPASRAAYEAKVDWFHKARYGLMFHFIASVNTSGWTSEKWNAWIDAIDVEKVADQAKEVGAGYVVTCISQVDPYYCAPNPVIEKYWGLKPGQFGSKRDLPMDLSRALAKRGIRMMLYTHARGDFPGPYGLPLPPGMDKATAYRRWLEVMQWDSDHYGKAVSGWWVDALDNYVPDYAEDFLAALRHGNPDTLVNGPYESADFVHGHCFGAWDKDCWEKQQQILPYYGRWEPEFNIQWHAFQHLGPDWAQPGVAHSTPDMVSYVKKIAAGGGVITFDLATHDGKGNGPFLEIADDQMAQLCAIRDALKGVPLTDGADMRQQTLERLLMTVTDEFIQLHATWPLYWSDTFALKAPQGIQIRGKVQDGVLVELEVTPADRRQDIKLPMQNYWVYDAAGWKVSRLMPAGDITIAPYLPPADDGAWTPVPHVTGRGQAGRFINVNEVRGPDGIVYLARKVKVAEAGEWILHVGHDGGARVFVDGKAVGGEAKTVKPAPAIRTSVPVKLAAGEHEIVVALDRAGGLGWGIYVSFEIPENLIHPTRKLTFPEPT